MRIAIGCDQRGLRTKEGLKRLLEEMGHTYQDFGTFTEEPVDYPDIARAVAEAVASGQAEQGILVCSTGIGMRMAANKVPGVRAATCPDTFTARRAREHNDANVLCLGEWITGAVLAQEIARAYLSAKFEGGRHTRRVDKIRAIEADYGRSRKE